MIIDIGSFLCLLIKKRIKNNTKTAPGIRVKRYAKKSIAANKPAPKSQAIQPNKIRPKVIKTSLLKTLFVPHRRARASNRTDIMAIIPQASSEKRLL